jgi:hypothetical protein
LAPTIADCVGYNVAQQGWPQWIEEAAAQIVAEARRAGHPSAKDP